MKEFVYKGRPAHVVFGAGSLQHLERGFLVLSTPEQRAQALALASRLGEGQRAYSTAPQCMCRLKSRARHVK